jgi:multiple sugar transport system permease protein
LAALSNVPPELVEAAQIDGASRWQVFRHITWPQLAPTTFFILVMSFIGALQGGFDSAKVMTGGGPAGTTTTLAYYIYTKGFEEFEVGYASMVSWVLFAIILAVTLMYWKFGNREGADL